MDLGDIGRGEGDDEYFSQNLRNPILPYFVLGKFV